MTNARGSKSARTAKAPKTPKTPPEGGSPEVVIEGGTVAVLPNPADAPAPAKTKMRRSSKEPKMLATEVPDWARRAEKRDTAADMAAVPETAVTPETTPAAPVAAPTAKKGRVPKLAKLAPKKVASKEAPTAVPGSLRAIGNAWIESLRAAGHSKSTVSSYGNDLEVAYEVLGGNGAAADLTEKQIMAFNESKAVLKKKNGKAKAKPTILKTRRALRLALVWAVQKGLIKKAPFAAKTSA